MNWQRAKRTRGSNSVKLSYHTPSSSAKVNQVGASVGAVGQVVKMATAVAVASTNVVG
jgi:hypothetical protein